MPAVVSVASAAAQRFPKGKGSGRSGLRGSACEITPESRRLIDRGLGCLRWTRRRETPDESLDLMRTQMLGWIRPSAAVFVGGVEGDFGEFEHCRKFLPRTPEIPIAGPGAYRGTTVDRRWAQTGS